MVEFYPKKKKIASAITNTCNYQNDPRLKPTPSGGGYSRLDGQQTFVSERLFWYNMCMKTYIFKLYNNDRTKYLDKSLDTACEIYNHCIALERRYYLMYGKHLSGNKLKVHITRLKRRRKYAHWKDLNSQAIQDVVERIERSYKAFFDHVKQKRFGRKRPPHFRKRRDYRSFTLKQTGYRLHGDVIIIMGRKYKYHKSRETGGNIKTVTVKKKPTGKWFIYIVTDEIEFKALPRTGKAVGIDFGLKDFLVTSDGEKIKSPEYLRQSLSELKRLSRNYSLKQDGSNNKAKAYHELMLLHERVSNQRRDYFFKLARYLCSRYDTIAIEDLNLIGMKSLWGRKVSDLAFAEFAAILEYVAISSGKELLKAGRFEPTTKRCSVCGHEEDLSLKDRSWICPSCGTHHDRDINAAINILTHAGRALPAAREGVSRTRTKAVAHPL